jgi:hypothetical protein
MKNNIEDIDDEELLCLYEATKKLLDSSLIDKKNSDQKKVSMLKQKIEAIEQELKARSL